MVALVAVVLLVSVSAVGLAGATTTPAPTTTAEPTAATTFAPGGLTTATSVDRETLPAADPNSTAAETANTTADTETYLLVLNDELTVGPIQTATDVTQAKQEAKRTQAPVVDRLETRGVEVTTQFWITNVIMTTVDPETMTPRDLEAIDGVTRVEPNAKFQHPEPQPSGEYIPTAEPTATTDALGATTYGLAAINVDGFVDAYGTNGSGTRVAVLDDGLNESHPDLHVARGVNVSGGTVSDPATTTLQQETGHGDHVAGTAVGTSTPAGDIPRYSVAPGAELLKADVFVDGATVADILAAIQWAVEADADVITMSLGLSASETDSTVILSVDDAIDNANTAGTVVIRSAGNEGTGTVGGPVISPGAEFPSGSIGAVNQNGDVASFSSGAQITPDTTIVLEDNFLASYPDHYPHTYVKPDVTAPGVRVVSAGPLGATLTQANATYSSASGTSMAAPHVAGAVALLQSATTAQREPDVLMNALAETAVKPDGATATSRDIRYGMGRIDVLAARNALEETTPIEGTVTGSGDRLTGARITTNSGVIAATDNGAYAIEPTTDATTVAVTANEYGYVPTTAAVPTGDSETLDFELNKIESLQVEFNDTEIETSATTTLTVTAVHPDGTESDIAEEATITNSNQIVATIDNTTVSGETAGTTTVTARYDGFVASRELTVTESMSSDPAQRALQIVGKDDPAELTQTDVSNAITRFERNERANGIEITQRDVSNVITLFERN